MSGLSKYKSTNTGSSSANANLPIWCSLSTPSQIARKYASIAPIWCHISRPRQLKQKFKSTFSTATNLLSRQHSKDDRLAATNGREDDSADRDPSSRYNDMNTAINTFKNANQGSVSGWKSSQASNGGGGGASSQLVASMSKGKLSSAYENGNTIAAVDSHHSILKKPETTGARWASSSVATRYCIRHYFFFVI